MCTYIKYTSVNLSGLITTLCLQFHIIQGFLVDEEMKANDDGTVDRREYIRNHHTDEDLKSYMYQRQTSNPDLFRWDGVANDGRVAIDANSHERTDDRTSWPNNRSGAEIELRSGTLYPQESRI